MRYLIPALASGLILAGAAIAQAQNSTTITTSPGGVSGSTTVTNSQGKPCRIVHSDAATGGSLSSSVTAGGGSVSSSTSGGGSSVTVHSGSGSASSSATTSSSGGGTTAMTSSDGDCVIVVPKDSQATK